jgi:predicted nucleic acid-binding protein
LNVCVDSSLIVSLYVIDANSPRAVQRMSQRPDAWLTPLNRTELAHAVQQRVFRKEINEFEARRIWTAFEDDCVAGVWEFVSFPNIAWQTSLDLARRFGPTLGMRTLDTLHVACALELGADRFWTFDERQARLAAAAGLDTTT